MNFRRIRNICSLFLAVGVILASVGTCEDFQYESHGKRDPFVPLVGSEKPTIAKLEDITSIDDINLEGIAVGARGIRSAIINGEILRQGSKVGDIEIRKIGNKMVTLSISGKEYTVKLPEEGGMRSE